MSPKIKKYKNPFDNEPKSARRGGVQDFGSFMPEQSHFKLTDFDGRAIYIVKLEPKFSDAYGDGYLIHFKDFPNAAQTMTAFCAGAIPKPQLDALYQATNEGRRISIASPVGCRIEVVKTKGGNSYKFLPLSSK